MELIKLATAGSVDDGKSTLIGRLLYETKSLKSDQIDHIKNVSKSNGLDFLDFSLATDGLLTEREQGITIDVSNIFFSTNNKRFVIADSPGHVEYTRNMVTGVSNSKAVVILLDARKGMIEQTKRHLFISKLLDIKHLVFAINKMDLINYNQSTFKRIVKSIKNWLELTETSSCSTNYIPISALKGENIIENSSKMSWYSGESFLKILEKIPLSSKINDDCMMQVQYVIRPKTDLLHDYRGFAGKISSGSFNVGDEVIIYPSKTINKVKSIEKFGSSKKAAVCGECITLLLKDEVDISRGSMICNLNNNLTFSKNHLAKICWMQNLELTIGNKYWLQLGVTKIQIKIINVSNKFDFKISKEIPCNSLGLNDIGLVEFVSSQEFMHKSFNENNKLGAFILIDFNTNNTAAVGFMQ